MIGVSRDNEYIVITIRVIGWAILGAVCGATIDWLAAWLFWPGASVSRESEAVWYFRLETVLAVLVGGVGGGVAGLILGLIETRSIRLAGASGVLLGSLVALATCGFLGKHTHAGQTDWALLWLKYLLTGSVVGMLMGVIVCAAWRRYRGEITTAAPLGSGRWKLVEHPPAPPPSPERSQQNSEQHPSPFTLSPPKGESV